MRIHIGKRMIVFICFANLAVLWNDAARANYEIAESAFSIALTYYLVFLVAPFLTLVKSDSPLSGRNVAAILASIIL